MLTNQRIINQIDLNADILLSIQGTWSKRHLVDGMTAFISDIFNGHYDEGAIPTVADPSISTNHLINKYDLLDTLNSDQGPYEKLHNIRALLEGK